MRFLDRLRRVGAVALGVLLAVVVVLSAVVAPLVAYQEPGSLGRIWGLALAAFAVGLLGAVIHFLVGYRTNTASGSGVAATATMTGLGIALLAMLATILEDLGAIPEVDDRRMLARLIWWHAFDALPGLSVPDAFTWEKPAVPASAAVGVLTVAARLMVLVGIVDAIRIMWTSADHHRTRPAGRPTSQVSVSE